MDLHLDDINSQEAHGEAADLYMHYCAWQAVLSSTVMRVEICSFTMRSWLLMFLLGRLLYTGCRAVQQVCKGL